MTGWAVAFFVLALVAGAFGFGGGAPAWAGMARILFFLSVVIFVVLLITGTTSPRPPSGPRRTRRRTNP
jgi:uncharacterized membrane protein YtjA (UPF0391 family)